MKRMLLALAVTTALVLPAAALAKGPSEASMTGPGLDTPLQFAGSEQPGSPLGDLTQEAGFFPAVFGQQPNPMLPARPKGDLGPRYTVEYTVPQSDTATVSIEQDVYPYARPDAVTYMRPGQAIFGATTNGGWYGSPLLLDVLVKAGLPRQPSEVSAPSSNSAFLSTGRLGALVSVVLILVAGAMLITRRRPRQTAA